MLSWRDPTLGCWKFNAYLRRSVQTCSAVLGGARGEAVPQHSGTDRKAQRVKIPLVTAKLACTNPNEEDTGSDSPGSGKDERNKLATRKSSVASGVIGRRYKLTGAKAALPLGEVA